MAIVQKADPRLIRAREEKYAKIISGTLSPNTIKNYQIDLKKFQEAGYSIPCSTKDVVDYLVEISDKLGVSGITRRLKAIKFVHKYNKYVDPTDHDRVKQVMQGIKRKYGKPIKKAKPISIEDLKKIKQYLDSENKYSSIRNLALILLCFFGAFRRNEVLRIEHRHLTFSDEGLKVFVPRSKTDQHNKGEYVCIPRLNNELCPVKALEHWLAQSNIKQHYIFPTLSESWQGMKMDPKKYLKDASFNLTFDRIIKKSGLEEGHLYSTHSLRRGFATEAAKNGASMLAIQKQGRWVSMNSMLGYVDLATQFKGNAALVFDESQN